MGLEEHTAGLNIAPLISEKTATFAARATAKTNDIYINLDGSGNLFELALAGSNGLILAGDSLAICVPAKAMARNIKVPTNSPKNTVSSSLMALCFFSFKEDDSTDPIENANSGSICMNFSSLNLDMVNGVREIVGEKCIVDSRAVECCI